jgi:DNA repair exonuclease SbcCD ATPase subunit
MKILNVKWKNFGPYGNVWTEIDFSKNDNEFSLLHGKNGSGKSSILEVIQFALYGKVNTKKLKELPNRLNNEKNLLVEIHIVCNNYDVVIQRGVSPGVFDVTINGSKDVGDMAGKLNLQDYLEEEIFQMPFYVFNNTISLSVNDFKSFIKMSPKDKRGILDKIFSLSIINQMYELLKQDVKKIKEQQYLIINKCTVLNNQIEKSVIELDKLNNKIRENIDDRKLEIAGNVQKLKKLRESLTIEINEYNSNERELVQQINQIKATRNKEELYKNRLEEKIDFYNNEKCPECGSDLHTDFHYEISKDYTTKLKNSLDTVDKLDETLKTLNENRNQLSSNSLLLNKKIHKIDANSEVLLKEFKELKNNDKIDHQTSSMQNLINTNQTELNESKKEQSVIENQLSFYSIIDEILNDNGIKKLAIKTILPSLNTQISQLIKDLSLDFKLVFDESFEAKIVHLGKEISSATLSTGENKKLDFAVIISIIRLMKYKFPGLNLLFLDELFSSLDQDANFLILKILNKVSKELNLHIFVINHSILDDSDFDAIYKIEKKNGFAQLIKTSQ